MRNRQLTDLQADVRKAADIQNFSSFISDSDITEYINQGWTRIYGILCRSGESHYLVQPPVTFNAVAGQDTYYTTSATVGPASCALLPTDMFLVKGLQAQVQSGIWQNVERANFDELNDLANAYPWSWPARLAFEYNGSGVNAALRIEPAPPVATTFRLWYYPAAVRLSGGTDTIDGGNGWELYAIWYAARECASRDENWELVVHLEAKMLKMEQEIKTEASSRVAGRAPKMRRSRYNKFPSSDGGWGWGFR